MRHTTSALLATAAFIPAVAGGQQWRTVEAARQLTDSQATSVSIKYAAGTLDVAPLEGRLLYQMRIRYDEQATDAVHRYDVSEHQLELGLKSASVGWRALKNMNHDKGGSMSVGLGRSVPMDLEISLGGVEANLELGGLRITKLNLETGLAGTKLRFSQPNRAQMEQLSVDLGLGGLKVSDLGNANVGEISIDGGMGGVFLDFGDAVMRDVTINADIAFGELRIAVPLNVGVMVRGEIHGGKFEHGIEFSRVDGAWYSENWKQSSRRITIVTDATLAKLRIDPTGR
jgi:hypothetical protein